MEPNNPQACPHCAGGFGLKYPLFENDCFWVVCDAHPLTEGHILIIPKKHVSCMGALDGNSFAGFKELYEKVLGFLNKTYGQAGVFEHGITGQTVFHAHMHFLPFNKSAGKVVPEKESAREISNLDELQREFNKENKYLFLAIGSKKFLVDTALGSPRFFRDRFAKALSAENKGNWKKSEDNAELMKAFEKDIQALKNKWKLFFNKNSQNAQN